MSEKPPFDTIKWSFVLVACVIGVQCAVILAGVVFCWTAETESRCDGLRQQLNELLTTALAAAIAFAGGFSRKDKP